MSHPDYASGDQPGVVGQATERVQEKASELREQGSSRLREQLDTRSTEIGSQARAVAEALRRSTAELREKGNTGAATASEQAAERIERLGSYLEQMSGNEMMRDVENFARRRPWMITGVALLAGLAASRFVKATSEQRYGDYRSTGDRRLPSVEPAGAASPAMPEPGYAGSYRDTGVSREPVHSGR